MARDAIAITSLVLNDGVAEPAGTTITPANGAYIDCGGDTQGLFLVVKNTAGAEYDTTIKAGDNPPALLAGQGDLVEPVAATSGVKFICLESARFVQSDGLIHVDFETSMTGKAMAYRLPQGL